MNIRKTLFLCALLGAFILTFVMLPPGTLSLEGIKTHQQALLS
ncbi:TVP38/TMEM64 family protein, partial [Enterobacter hormaechei]